MTVDERSQRFTPRCDVRISHPSSLEVRVSERNAFTSDARQVERKIKRAPFSLVRRDVITLLCADFVVPARLSRRIAFALETN